MHLVHVCLVSGGHIFQTAYLYWTSVTAVICSNVSLHSFTCDEAKRKGVERKEKVTGQHSFPFDLALMAVCFCFPLCVWSKWTDRWAEASWRTPGSAEPGGSLGCQSLGSAEGSLLTLNLEMPAGLSTFHHNCTCKFKCVKAGVFAEVIFRVSFSIQRWLKQFMKNKQDSTEILWTKPQ